MEKVYVFGHRNPDTDSVTAAITLAYLKRKQGLNAIPVILSSISKETSYALNYFKVKEQLFNVNHVEYAPFMLSMYSMYKDSFPKM